MNCELSSISAYEMYWLSPHIATTFSGLCMCECCAQLIDALSKQIDSIAKKPKAIEMELSCGHVSIN